MPCGFSHIDDADLYHYFPGQYLYISLGFKIWQKHGKLVSNLKLYAYIAHQKKKILECIDLEDLEADIAYYAVYDKRRKRLNHLERLLQISDYQHEYA